MRAWESLKPLVPRLSRECRRIGDAYDFDTFVVGCQFSDALGPDGGEPGDRDAARRYLNAAVGAYLSRLWRHRRVDFKRPDFRFHLRLAERVVLPEITPVYLRGRYRKLVRGIPQSRWPCRRCRGEGCERCGGTGRVYSESVEELLAGPVLEATGGTSTRIHCMGREDIDARMLGEGRPFVLEVLSPRRRKPDPGVLSSRIRERAGGRVEGLGLRWVSRDDVVAVKGERAEKTYRAGVAHEGRLPEDFVDRIRSLGGRVVRQRTPLRVEHRRADLVRDRIPRAIEVELVEGEGFAVVIRAEAGMYIKEFVSGDAGRSESSIAGALGIPCRCVALDVIGVHAAPDRAADAE